ncbi:PulJ/GspJ family protein [Spirilliplanes yamanashiensis]|uniref:Prepilin-type N-terminal cleavage/methylation domain-containing protein n=1 Tax=Spirilliplanes yamanashiensis TaxID=42233 RepID=A0A8J3Y7F9_9ACTN|nr:type II secretion system protein [Spirilliplanes yamanashiensis]MDP9817134.1 prepilin-type N-terminal cleavage/methylation domain-containing protein [Spirilliplanes yamanashiensis]GIJ03213.1 hypothetical protein Sya03_25650 [Spirilliplanes yamanashiensis]
MTGRRPAGPAGGSDDGMTLLEVLVSMSVMAVVLVVATAGLLPVYRLVNDADLQDRAQSALSVAMLRLDRQVRYAVRVSVAVDGRSATYLSVEPGAARKCHAVRWSVTSSPLGVLQQRSWTAGGSPGATWSTLATDLRIDRTGFTRPFTLSEPTDDVDYQRLQIKLVSSAANGRAERRSDVTFSALNTDTTQANPC